MGQLFCCRERVRLPDLEEDLHITNEDIIQLIQQLRQKHKEEIQQSQTILIGSSIFRGKIDQNKQKQGYGQHYFQNRVYFGMFESDKPNGEGLAIRDDFSYYRGQFKDQLFHGYGKEYAENFSFQGEFEEGNRVKGIFINENFEYHGTFKQNLFDGEGTIIFKEGTKYEGEFKEGKICGKGVVNFANGKLFKGEFVDGKCWKGKFSYLNKLKAYDENERNFQDELKSESELLSQPDNPTDFLLYLFKVNQINKNKSSKTEKTFIKQSGIETSPGN